MKQKLCNSSFDVMALPLLSVITRKYLLLLKKVHLENTQAVDLLLLLIIQSIKANLSPNF
jgi:hypothetical protein